MELLDYCPEVSGLGEVGTLTQSSPSEEPSLAMH